MLSKFRIPLIITSLWIALLLTGISSAKAAPLPLGSSIPSADVEMTSVDGKAYTLSQAEGENGTMVIFTCNHCPYVKAWQERTVAIANDAQSKGVGVIAINANDPAAYPEDGMKGMIERAKAQGMKYPYVVDATSDVARAFGATRTPEIFLFDMNGKLVYHGAVDDDAQNPGAVKEHYLRNAVDALVNGKPIAVSETKSVGCSIKFR